MCNLYRIEKNPDAIRRLFADIQIPLTFPTDCICYRYTHGYFRQTDFTQPRRECAARHGRELHPVPPIVIVAD